MGYKKSQTINIERCTIIAIIQKRKYYRTTASLLREGRPPKLMGPEKGGINQGNTKRPKITLKKLGGSNREMGVSNYRATINHVLHRAVEWPGKIRLTVLNLPKGILENTQICERRCCGQMRLKCSFSAIKHKAISHATLTPLIML